MMQSEIVLFHCYTRACPLNSLDAITIVEPCHNDPKWIGIRPHEILFRVTLVLDSDQKLNEHTCSQQGLGLLVKLVWVQEY